MDVIRTNFRFYDPYSLPFAQSPQDFSYGFPFLLAEYFPTVFWCEHNVIFAIPFRSVYKELHADHETGAADNK